MGPVRVGELLLGGASAAGGSLRMVVARRHGALTASVVGGAATDSLGMGHGGSHSNAWSKGPRPHVPCPSIGGQAGRPDGAVRRSPVRTKPLPREARGAQRADGAESALRRSGPARVHRCGTRSGQPLRAFASPSYPAVASIRIWTWRRCVSVVAGLESMPRALRSSARSPSHRARSVSEIGRWCHRRGPSAARGPPEGTSRAM
jgi:hypothetical protein